ncbi:ABC transporter permease subunit [Ectopseudomonas mendocina]|uniref:ABC transporter permease subunit n=1 Tax=Ectopseudomonas mendocina TaxID=300 RepID=A0ABZ2RQH5_ECTME
MNFSWFNEFSPELVQGAWVTVQLLLISAVIGFSLALLVAFARLSSCLPVALLGRFYVSVLRGTPLLVQIFIFYYGVGMLLAGWPWLRASWLWPYLREGFFYVAVALSLSVSAYVGEVLRAGLRAVPKGELEAARAYGMSPLMVIRRVWLVRALQQLRPTLAGEAVMLLKSTALASTVALMDLLGAANLVRAQTLKVYEPLLLVAVVYIVLAFAIEQSIARLGHKPQARPRMD